MIFFQVNTLRQICHGLPSRRSSMGGTLSDIPIQAESMPKFSCVSVDESDTIDAAHFHFDSRYDCSRTSWVMKAVALYSLS